MAATVKLSLKGSLCTADPDFKVDDFVHDRSTLLEKTFYPGYLGYLRNVPDFLVFLTWEHGRNTVGGTPRSDDVRPLSCVFGNP